MRPFCALMALLVWGPFCAAEQTGQTSSEIQKAIEEFRLQTRNLGLRSEGQARKRAGAAARAGWHGRLFENFRNDFLDAVPHEIRQRGGTKSLLRRNQFGFNVGGPVVIPRLYAGGRDTHFSISYEGVRERISRSYLRTIPTLPERVGDFSAVVDLAGNPLPIYDLLTTRLSPAFRPSEPVSPENLQYSRAPFPENRIPASRLDPVAQKALAYYPAPNAAVGPFFRNNFFSVSPETNTANGMIGKLDHSLRERHRLQFSVSFSNGFAGAARMFPDAAADPNPSDRDFATRRGEIQHVFTLSPQTVNTASFEVSSSTTDLSHGAKRDYAAQLGLRGIEASVFPVFRFSPYLWMGEDGAVASSARNTFMWSDYLSTRRGKHSLRVGGNLVRYQVNAFSPVYPAGHFRFSAGLTSLPGIVNTGHAFSSFVLGQAEFAELSYVDNPSYFRRSAATVIFREQYEAAKGLTLNLGANLDVSTPRVEKFDRQSTVDLNVMHPILARPGALIAAARNGIPRAFQPVRVRLEPSASVAWSPLGDTRTVIRAAFSRSYSAIPVYTNQWGTQGFTGSPAFISPNTQLEPAVRLSAGVPPPSRPLPDLRPEAADDTVADLMDRSPRQPVYQSSSISAERELPGSTVVTLGAYMSGGRELLVSNYSANPNAIPLSALAYRDRLNDEAFNRSLRPYPQYKGFDLYSSWPRGRYHRNAAFLRVEKRSSRGLSVSSSYEFSKQMDDYAGPYGIQNYFDLANEWSPTYYNSAHRLSLTFAYDLPFGVNRPYLAYSDWRRFVLSGWSVSGITSVVSGEPVVLHPQFNNTGGVLRTLYVDVVAGVSPHVEHPSPQRWFEPAAFAHPADFSLGTASRTHPSLRNPLSQNHDLSLSKRFTLSADRTLELNAMGLNFLNHANWNDPDAIIGTAAAPNVNAGRIIGSRGGRVIQLGMRFSF